MATRTKKRPAEIRREIETYLSDPLPIAIEALSQIHGEGRFGDRKVFISSLWERIRDRVRMTLPEFKAWLVAQHRAARLVLARADYVSAMSPEIVEASHVRHDGMADFHFVIDPSVR